MTYRELAQRTHGALAQYTHAQLARLGMLLIYDRTQADVDLVAELHALVAAMGPSTPAAEMDKWRSSLKGAYNTDDLNRVERFGAYLADTLTRYGYPVTINAKQDWAKTDFVPPAQLERIRANVNALRYAFYTYATTPSTPPLDPLNYQRANDLERILADIDVLVDNMRRTWPWCGIFTAEGGMPDGSITG